jgi:O-antigen ligase
MQTTYNANQLAIMQAISATMMIILMYKNAFPKVAGILLLLPMAVIILLTKSRTGTLLFALPILIYFLFIIIKEKRIWQGLIVAVAVLLLLVIVQKYFPVVWSGLWDRFTNEEDISGGRTRLNATYFAKWSSNAWCLLFGYGIGAYRKVVGMGTSPHNGFVDILISSGLVGLISLCVQWVTLFRYGAQNISRKTYLIAFLPVIIAAVESFAGQYLTMGYPHMRMCFLLLAASSFATIPQKSES